jgi:hypothetical protein
MDSAASRADAPIDEEAIEREAVEIFAHFSLRSERYDKRFEIWRTNVAEENKPQYRDSAKNGLRVLRRRLQE